MRLRLWVSVVPVICCVGSGNDLPGPNRSGLHRAPPGCRECYMNSKHGVHRRAFLRAIPPLASSIAVTALAQDTPSPSPLQLNLKIPAERPYLALTRAEIARAKDRARRFGWAKIVIDRTVAEANTSLAGAWRELPPKGTFPGHTRLGSRLFGAALAFNLTGNRKYAEWTRDGLLAYAAIYPGLPLMSLRYK